MLTEFTEKDLRGLHPLCQSRLGMGYRQFWRCRKNFRVSQWRD
jgi:hypothetical protein